MNGDLIDATITQNRLSDWLGGPKALEEECKLDMSDDGFYVTVVDKANVAYIGTTLSPTAFESYDYGHDEKKVYGLSITKLSNAIGVAGSDDLVQLLLDDEHSMRVEAGSVGFDHAGINPDTIRQRPEIPEIDYTTILENVPIESLKRGVKACDMVSDHLQFVVDPDSPDVIMRAEGDTDDAELSLYDGDTHLTAGEAETVLLSLDYMQSIVKAVPSDTTVDLFIRDDFPFRMEYEFADGTASAEVFLAPRIESD